MQRPDRMTGFIRRLLLAAALLLASCDGSAPDEIDSHGPEFEPVSFFTGAIRSWGVVESRSGDPRMRFSAEIRGWQDGSALVIEQRFVFGDGRTQERIWRLRRVDERRYEATADDVVGTAIGEIHGNAFRLDYTLATDPGNALKNVHMTQWMHAVGDGSTMMNRVTISKWGVTIAGVTEMFVRDPPAPPVTP